MGRWAIYLPYPVQLISLTIGTAKLFVFLNLVLFRISSLFWMPLNEKCLTGGAGFTLLLLLKILFFFLKIPADASSSPTIKVDVRTADILWRVIWSGQLCWHEHCFAVWMKSWIPEDMNDNSLGWLAAMYNSTCLENKARLKSWSKIAPVYDKLL